VIVIGGFMLLFLISATVSVWPQGRFAQRLQPHLFAGLYLDELFTRFTFRIWPVRLPDTARNLPPTTTGALQPRAIQEEISS
jgi:NAD(P)H-quinone oxidoreductase subunit 5